MNHRVEPPLPIVEKSPFKFRWFKSTMKFDLRHSSWAEQNWPHRLAIKLVEWSNKTVDDVDRHQQQPLLLNQPGFQLKPKSTPHAIFKCVSENIDDNDGITAFSIEFVSIAKAVEHVQTKTTPISRWAQMRWLMHLLLHHRMMNE